MIDLSDEAIGNLVGWNTLYRGVEYAASGRVERVKWSQGQSVLDGVVAGTRPQPYRVNILFNGGHTSRPSVGVCSCAMHINCKHVAATLISAREPVEGDPGAPSWRRMLEPLVRPTSTAHTVVALQLDLRPSSPEPLRGRPVVKGRSGRWIRGDVGWHLFGVASSPADS